MKRASSGSRARLRPAVLVAAGLALLGIVAVALVPLLGTAVVPTFADRNVLVRLEGQPGASNQWMTAKTTEVGSLLSAVPGVATVGGQVGRAVTGDRVVNVSSSDVWVTIAPDADYDETLAAIDGALTEVADVTAAVSTYTTQTMRDVGALTGGSSGEQTTGLDLLTGLDTPLAVRLFGQDPVVLAAQAERVKELMSGVEGLVSARDSPAAVCSPPSRSRWTWRRPNDSGSAPATYAGRRPPCCKASRWAVSSRSRRSSTSSCRARRKPGAAWRTSETC